MWNVPEDLKRDIFCAVVAGIDGGVYYDHQDKYHETIERNYFTAVATWTALKNSEEMEAGK